jgi:hypothetical protein
MAMKPSTPSQMRTASPWWLSVVFGGGLAFVMLGERLIGSGSARGMLTMLGVVLVIATTGVRAWTTFGTQGSRRKIERTLLICQVGALVALLLYSLTTDWGLAKFDMATESKERFEKAMTAIFAIVLLASVVPVLMVELSLGMARRVRFDMTSSDAPEQGVEYRRVRELAWSALSIALAASFLMVTCKVTSERNVQKDLSYFKTSSPGDSTKAIVKASPEPITVMLFFPKANQVGDQVRDYFQALASATGKIKIETGDRAKDPALATKYKVTKDGTIVAIRGTGEAEKFQSMDLDTDFEKARKGAGKLRNLDREVNSLMMKLSREKRKAYLMTGHGEINDPDSIPPELKDRVPNRSTTKLKGALTELNYETKELGLMDLAKDVPDDASVVVMLAPTLALQLIEWEALKRYVDKGGRLLIALDPKAERSLGLLEPVLGLRFNPGDLTDDKAFYPQRGTPADRRFALTNQFSSHASTTTLSRSVDKGLVLIDSGALEEVPFAPGTSPTRTMTVRSMDSSWLDFNNNFTFDAGSEKRQRWNIGAAIEGPKLKDGDGKDKDGFRALVFADADLFADVVVPGGMGRAQVIMVAGPLFYDAIRWLGGEEVLSGEVVSEDDKPIKHTKDQDTKWFIMMIIGAPALVFILGVTLGNWARRRHLLRGLRGKEVKS